MSIPTEPFKLGTRAVLGVVVACALVVALWWLVQDRELWPRGEALVVALQPLIDQQKTDQALVAKAILDNYLETRANASKWSGVYWGFTFLAAALSALAGLILKFESIFKNESVKKDLAATFAVVAALLITISTSGDFQRKWQANRIAAAELERIGYELLEKNAADPRSYFTAIAQTMYNRHVAIVGRMERREPENAASKSSPTKQP
jgi:hypothetical protein